MSSRRRAAALALFCLPGCSWLVSGEPEPLSGDGGFVPAALLVTGVDGTGSERAPSGVPEELEDVVPARHRLEDALVVAGEGLREVTKVALAATSGERRYDNLRFERLVREGASDVSLRVSLPAGVRAGLYTLTLVAAAHEVQAQVYLLQGEPGPPGPAGVAGARGPSGVSPPAGLTRVVTLPVGDPSCARGGARALSGTDDDGDGFLDDDEVQTSADACHGDPGPFACTGGACALSADLDVEGEVSVSALGASLPLAPQVTTPLELSVGPGGQYPDLHAALEALRPVRIASGGLVRLRLTAGEHVYTTSVTVNHVDGARIRIEGATANPVDTVIRFIPAQPEHGVRVVRSGLGGLAGLTLRYEGPSASNGVVVNAATADLGPNLRVQNFRVGISAYNGAVVFANGDATSHLEVSGHLYGLFAQSSTIQARAAYLQTSGVEGSIGAHAVVGGTIYADDLTAIGHVHGALASVNSRVQCQRAVAVGPTPSGTHGFTALYGSVVDAAGGSVSGVQLGYYAVYQSTVLATGVGTAATVTPYCAGADSSVLKTTAAGAANHTTCP